jgi:hypothetical protein
MTRHSIPTYLCVCLVLLQSCYSLSNISTIKLEIIVPGSLKIPQEYKNIAVGYNNANIAFNPHFSNYIEDNEIFTDTTNLDSIASEIYFKQFVSHLKNQQFFGSIIELEPMIYCEIEFSDSLVLSQFKINEPADSGKQLTINKDVINFTKLVKSFSNPNSKTSKIKFIDPEFGLYSREDIEKIADSTNADLLLSFDYYGTADGIFSPKYIRDLSETYIFSNYNLNEATEVVHVLSGWNFYDLKKLEMIYSHIKTDTIKWSEPAYNLSKGKKVLPPRRDAVLNAADITGSNFAEFVAPHWVEVERMYYKSGQVEMKKADELINQNRWLEAAEIWKKNTTNKNKKIAAKSMFNLALACEMNGDMDAAIDWAVKSFYVLQKDSYHTGNCQNYINILGRRKLDIRKIEGI